jgi:predicted RNA polymerase sigma factor
MRPPSVAGRALDDVAADIVEVALRASVAGLPRQMRVAIHAVRAEAEAVKQTDPRKVRAVTDIDVAERKAELIRGTGGGA